jgi:tetratricopeptide (TPR) repeat protein
MTTNIYILKGGQQHGPYRPEDLKTFLQNGQMAPTLLARFDGGAGWVPVFCIPEIQADPSLAPLLRSTSSGDQSVELAVVESTLKATGQLIERLARSTSAENAALQKEIHRKTQVLWRQLFTFKGQFPETAESKVLEASYYRALALSKFNAAGFLRRQSQDATNIVWGVFTGVLANRQERAGALEALSLLDKAVAVFDNPEDRLTKAGIYNLLGQRDDALRELSHLLASWPATENLDVYIEARQLRDEIETA